MNTTYSEFACSFSVFTSIAHGRIQSAFRRLSKTGENYGGVTCGIRGDTRVVEVEHKGRIKCIEAEREVLLSGIGDPDSIDYRTSLYRSDVLFANGNPLKDLSAIGAYGGWFDASRAKP